MFRVGQKVRIRVDLDTHADYRNYFNDFTDCVNSDMLEFRGRIATITNVGNKYDIDLDDGMWNWTDEMFECVVGVGRDWC